MIADARLNLLLKPFPWPSAASSNQRPGRRRELGVRVRDRSIGGKGLAFVCEKTTAKVHKYRKKTVRVRHCVRCIAPSNQLPHSQCLMGYPDSLSVIGFSVPSESQWVWRNPYHLSTVLQLGTPRPDTVVFRFSPSMDRNLPLNRAVCKCKVGSGTWAHTNRRVPVVRETIS